MTFQEAKNKLKKLANGRHHRVDFALSEFSDGDLQTQVWLYIDRGHGNKPISSDFVRDFGTAFRQLEERLGVIGNEEIPEVAA